MAGPNKHNDCLANIYSETLIKTKFPSKNAFSRDHFGFRGNKESEYDEQSCFGFACLLESTWLGRRISRYKFSKQCLVCVGF